MSGLESNARSQPIDFWSKFPCTNFIEAPDAEKKSFCLTVLVLSSFSVMIASITCQLGYLAFAFSSVLTLTIYSFFDSNNPRRRILLSCLIICIGFWLIRLSKAPIGMEYCQIETISFPHKYNDSLTDVGFAIQVCAGHKYSFSTYPSTNTSEPLSPSSVTPKLLYEMYKSSLDQLSSRLPESKIKSWNSLMEKHLEEWMKWIYEEKGLKEQAETGGMDVKFDSGRPVRKDGVGKVNDGGVGDIA